MGLRGVCAALWVQHRERLAVLVDSLELLHVTHRRVPACARSLYIWDETLEPVQQKRVLSPETPEPKCCSGAAHANIHFSFCLVEPAALYRSVICTSDGSKLASSTSQNSERKRSCSSSDVAAVWQKHLRFVFSLPSARATHRCHRSITRGIAGRVEWCMEFDCSSTHLQSKRATCGGLTPGASLPSCRKSPTRPQPA